MQLAANDSHREDASENEPILQRSDVEERSEGSSFSSEITTVGGEFAVAVDDLESLDVDETCSLVHTDQPQCRICLENGGPYLLPFLISFYILSLFLSPGWESTSLSLSL